MFTLFDLFQLIGFVGGATLGGIYGWQEFGVLGALIGGTVGFLVGGCVGRLPIIVVLKFLDRSLDRMTNDELLEHLHEKDCLTPNLVLLELKIRGEEIDSELPHI